MKVIVLTGGPCAGKSDILARMREKFGKDIAVVDEVASWLLSTGRYPMPDPWTQAWQDGFQAMIVAEQTRMEAEAIAKAESRGVRVVVCDRGLLDGAAYMAGGVREFCERFGVDEAAALARYELVIHLESLSTLNPGLYVELMATNPARFEPVEEAAKREMALREAWSGHKKRIHLAGDIEESAVEVMDLVNPFL